jgi:hypothetical protein
MPGNKATERKGWGGEAMWVALAIGLAASLAGRRAAPPERPPGAPEHGPSPVVQEALQEALEEDALYCPPSGTLLDSGPAPGADSAHCSAPLTLNSTTDFREADARR